MRAEIGIGTNHEFPKPLTDEFAHAVDVLVTMGSGDACCTPASVTSELPDPAGQGTDAVRTIRDEIDRRVRDLLVELTS